MAAPLIPIKYAGFDHLSRPSLFLCWFRVAPKTWAVLFAGWLCVLLSFLFSFYAPSSGAVLICAAVSAEILFERLHYRSLPRAAAGEYPLIKLDTLQNEVILHHQNIPVLADAKDPEYGALLGLSVASEWSTEDLPFQGTHQHGAYWFYSRTIDRVTSVVTKNIFAAIIIGTLIWGYGEPIIKFFARCA